MTENIETLKNVYEVLKFNVKGITFENEDGKDIQKEIRKIYLEYEKNGCFEKYRGYTNEEIKEFVSEVAEFEDAEVEIELKEGTYENNPCVKIYIKKYDGDYFHVGYMPKELVSKYLKLRKNYKEMEEDVVLTGGKYKTTEWDVFTDKCTIQTDELNYGFAITLTFYDNEKLYNEEKEKNKQAAIEEYNKKLEQENRKKLEQQRILEEEIRKINRKNNIELFIVIVIISIPFIWLLYKILNFVFWILE